MWSVIVQDLLVETSLKLKLFEYETLHLAHLVPRRVSVLVNSLALRLTLSLPLLLSGIISTSSSTTGWYCNVLLVPRHISNIMLTQL